MLNQCVLIMICVYNSMYIYQLDILNSINIK